MIIFEDIQDVEEWMADQTYATIWEATAPWGIFDADYRAFCDQLISSGKAEQDTVLTGLRIMVRLTLAARFALTDRVHEPTDAQYLASMH